MMTRIWQSGKFVRKINSELKMKIHEKHPFTVFM